MKTSDDAKLIAASILTLAMSANRISKKLDNRPSNEETYMNEIINRFALVLANQLERP